MKNQIIEKIRNGLIVSCQAHKDWPMYGSNIMAAFARAAYDGGAVGIRASGCEDIKAIMNVVDLPIIGIQKHWSTEFEAFITPSWDDAKEILKLGVDIIELDAGDRTRPNGETFSSIVEKIRKEFPDVLIMGEVGDFAEAERIKPDECDLISTTLSGYTSTTKNIDKVDIELIRMIHRSISIPVIAEGHVSHPTDAKAALEAGALAVVVGTAITRPEIITKIFVQQLNV